MSTYFSLRGLRPSHISDISVKLFASISYHIYTHPALPIQSYYPYMSKLPIHGGYFAGNIDELFHQYKSKIYSFFNYGYMICWRAPVTCFPMLSGYGNQFNGNPPLQCLWRPYGTRTFRTYITSSLRLNTTANFILYKLLLLLILYVTLA